MKRLNVNYGQRDLSNVAKEIYINMIERKQYNPKDYCKGSKMVVKIRVEPSKLLALVIIVCALKNGGNGNTHSNNRGIRNGASRRKQKPWSITRTPGSGARRIKIKK